MFPISKAILLALLIPVVANALPILSSKQVSNAQIAKRTPLLQALPTVVQADEDNGEAKVFTIPDDSPGAEISSAFDEVKSAVESIF